MHKDFLFHRLLIVTPILLALHNIEEAVGLIIMMPKLQTLFKVPYTIKQFILSLIIITILGFVVTIIGTIIKKGKYFLNIMTVFVTILFINAFIPHILASVFFHIYIPGVITSVFLYLPFSIYILYKIYNERLIKKNKVS